MFQLRVRARDGGTPRLSATALVTVTVDRNLFSPVFSQDLYEETILETREPGDFALFFRASDADKSVIIF